MDEETKTEIALQEIERRLNDYDRLREINAELLADIKTLFELHEAVCFRAEIDPQGARAVLERAIAKAERDSQ